jgi:hypothetical protein
MKQRITARGKGQILLCAATFLIFALCAGWLLRAAQSNYVMLTLAEQLWQASADDTYRFANRSLLAALPQDETLQALNARVKQSWLPDFAGQGNWATGRLALAVGDGQTARTALAPLQSQARTNPFLYLDRLQSLSLADSLAYAAQNPAPAALQAISDTLAAALYAEGTTSSLRRAYELRPQDLAVNYALWQSADSDRAAAKPQYLAALQAVSAEAVDAAHPQLLLNTLAIIPRLYAAGIWDLDTTRAAARYFVWRHALLPEVAAMVQALTDQDPAQYDWLLLAAELSARQGEYARAEELYQQVLAQDTHNWGALYGLARSRLALADDDSAAGELAAGAQLLAGRLQQTPGDPLLMDVLLQTYTRLGDERAAVLRSRQDTLLDDRVYVAGELGVPAGGIRLGPNLLANGNMNTWQNGVPEDFTYQWSASAGTTAQTYFAGLDRLWHSGARILALNQPLRRTAVPPYAEYISQPFELRRGRYVVTMTYCLSEPNPGTALVYLGEYDQAGTVLLHAQITDTETGCGIFRALVSNAVDLAKVRLLARNGGAGDFQILGLTLRELY